MRPNLLQNFVWLNLGSIFKQKRSAFATVLVIVMTTVGTAIIGIAIIGIAIAIHPLAAQAAPICRQVGDHQVCILDIKRSAKNYWEYRAVVKIDDEPQPKAVYNCRDRTRTLPKTGQVVPFDPEGGGLLICQILYR
ncbi:MAG: hypothetical protein AB4042_16640 [Leptolyngbyaceae cyanobacterium]